MDETVGLQPEQMSALAQQFGRSADALSGAYSSIQRAVDAAWAVVDDILDDATPVHAYKPGTWGPAETKRIAPIEGWHDPVVEG